MSDDSTHGQDVNLDAFARYVRQLADAIVSAPANAYQLLMLARTQWRSDVPYRTTLAIGLGALKVSVLPTPQIRVAELAEIYLGSTRAPQQLLGAALYRAVLARQAPAKWWGTVRYEELVALWAGYPPQNAETAKLRSAVRAAFLGSN